MVLACQVCNSKFYVAPNKVAKGYGKYCGQACYGSALRGRKIPRDVVEKIRQRHIGRKNTPETLAIMSAAAKARIERDGLGNFHHKLGPDSTNWRGGTALYISLHNWVKRQLGTPRYCEHCGRTDAKCYNWANKSGRYLRDISDWSRLCRSCHTLFDQANPKRPERIFGPNYARQNR